MRAGETEIAALQPLDHGLHLVDGELIPGLHRRVAGGGPAQLLGDDAPSGGRLARLVDHRRQVGRRVDGTSCRRHLAHQPGVRAERFEVQPQRRKLRQVIADPNLPPDESSGLGDWVELESWSRKEPMLTAYVGFSTAPWYGVVNRKAVRRQYQVLTARVGGKSFWASAWVYPLLAAIGMGMMLVIGLIVLMVVDDKQISYKVVDGVPVAVIGHWFNWRWVFGLMLGVGAPMSLGGWPITLWSMWRVAFGDIYALQLQPVGTRLKYKLKFKTAILNHASNSQAFGGSTIRGGGLKGGYAVHITREDLMTMPARKVLDLPLRGGNARAVADWLATADDGDNVPEELGPESGDAIETLMADGDHLFDGAQARTTAADGSTIQKAGEIKLQWAKKKQGRQIPVNEIGAWIIILIMVIAIFIQLQSGFTVTDTVTGAF